ncbi:UDP-galactopyranose/dTDP-fucopyranose mutase family protein [Allorhizobium undicola]|uniref:UDP-galactopyranose/dTDP-fucopyranose mutase family protein n=1 Tax=Allorhizobium undicola TaxID=78527 RepID=UPI00068551E1|nr:UDP-galactopyranose mutase [Allorhizobium undicola]
MSGPQRGPGIAGLSANLAVAGAGLSGAVIAREMAEAGHRVTVFEGRDHVAGNCHTKRDAETGILLHVYGPHIFHTDDEGVWNYVNRFQTFRPYLHRVKITSGGQVYSLPVNLHTINQFFGAAMGPDAARSFIAAEADAHIESPETFEEQALRFVGRRLYEAFFKGYTEKQWGCAPSSLPAAILKRLPLRFNYDDRYFSHRFQAMPETGYTDMVARMLDHDVINLRLNTPFRREWLPDFDHVFYSGPIDAFYGFDEGRLGYRTLDFERFIHPGDYQGCAVMNYADRSIPHTRITEHKHFAPWEEHGASICYRETSRACGENDIPYYPIRLVQEKQQLSRYVARAAAEKGVSFVGRLGTYRYLDMDVTIREALDCAALFQHCRKHDLPVPAFAIAPL